MRSLNYLQEEKKLRKWGLLNKNKSTYDWIIRKYQRCENVPVPRRFLSSSDKPSEPKSSSRGSKRSQPDDAGTRIHFFGMYPSTLIVHRSNQCLRGSQIKYSTYEHAEIWPVTTDGLTSMRKMSLNQYSSNELEDFSFVSVGMNDFFPTLPIHEPDLKCSISLHSSR